MKPETKAFFVGIFVAAVAFAFVTAENDHQDDLNRFKNTQYTPSLYDASDSNN